LNLMQASSHHALGKFWPDYLKAHRETIGRQADSRGEARNMAAGRRGSRQSSRLFEQERRVVAKLE
jgi:hypothetical protein